MTSEKSNEEDKTLTMKVVIMFSSVKGILHLGKHHVFSVYLRKIDDSEQYIIVSNSNLYLFQSPMLLN